MPQSSRRHPTPARPRHARASARQLLAAVAVVALALTAVTAVTGPAAADDPPELVVNGDFGAGLPPWFDTTGSASFGTGELCATVPGGTTNPWDVIIGQNDIALQLNENYLLSFDARASQDVTVRAIVGNSNPNFETLTDQSPALTTTSAHFEYPFSAWEDLPTGQVAFQVGGKSATPWTFCVDNVSLVGGQAPPVYTPDTGPRVRVNQVGYLPRGPKTATVVTEATSPLPWELKDSAGNVIATGDTTPQRRRPDRRAQRRDHRLQHGDEARDGLHARRGRGD